MIEMAAGASVTFCSYFEAAYTDGISAKKAASSPGDEAGSSDSGSACAALPSQKASRASIPICNATGARALAREHLRFHISLVDPLAATATIGKAQRGLDAVDRWRLELTLLCRSNPVSNRVEDRVRERSFSRV
jgi:hypothetical protein